MHSKHSLDVAGHVHKIYIDTFWMQDMSNVLLS